MVKPSTNDALVEGARRDLRQPLLFGLAVGGICGSVGGLAAWTIEGRQAGVVVACVTVAIFVSMGATQAAYWFLRAGSTSYEVIDGRLVVRRRGRVVTSWPCSSIHEVDFGSAPRFHQTLFHKSGGGLPELRVVAGEGELTDRRRYLGWPLLLTAPSEVAAAEQRIRDAVAASSEVYRTPSH